MPKAKVHWSSDLLAVALIGSISGLVFWLVPPAEPARATLALKTTSVVSSLANDYAACSADIS